MEPDAQHPLSPAERDEYERLHRMAQKSHRRLRYAGATVLLVLAILLAPLAVVAAWVDAEVSDTDRYVQTVAPIATEPAVQNAVTDRLTSRVVSQVDVAAVTAQLAKALAQAGAPPVVVDGAHALTGPLKNALTDAVHGVVYKVVTSDQFAQLWNAANRQAHAAVVKVLTGKGNSAIQAGGDTIELNIGTVVDTVEQRLINAGFPQAAKIPQVDKTVPLFTTDKLNNAQTAMRLLNVLGVWLPVIAIVLAALGIWAAPAHRPALMTAAIGIGVMMIALLVALAVTRQVYLDSVPPSTLPQDAAGDIFDTFVRFLRTSAVTVLVIAVITALAGFLYGPARAARWVRSTARRGTGATGRALSRHGMRTGAAGRWLDTHQAWTSGVAIGAGVLALFLWNYPTPGSVALVLGIVVLVMAILGVLAAASGRGSAPGGGGKSPAAGDAA